MFIRSYKFRIFPTRAQVKMLERTLDICCELYNAALQERREAWRINRESVNYHAQAIQLPEIKAIRPELGMVHSQVLQDVLRRLDKAFDAFFRRVKSGDKAGFPRFRARARYDSFTYPQGPPKGGFNIKNGKLQLSKIGMVKIKLHRPIEGRIKTLTITRNSTGKWFACFSWVARRFYRFRMFALYRRAA
jgi:putative transposase